MSHKAKIFSVIIFLIVVAEVILLIFHINNNRVFFEYDTVTNCHSYSNEEERLRAEKLIADGYVISYPDFRNSFDVNNRKLDVIYSTITNDMADYANMIVDEYKNYAKLDYTVEVKENETLTVKFFGYGYSDDSEPVPLDKTFVYDIKNVSPKNLPKLISE